MKLKVSFCNPTVLRTDISRFAPVWGAYTLGLAMLVLFQLRPGDTDDAKASLVYTFNLISCRGVCINGIYALVVVQALFGDLLNPRLCNSLHAMPITRDGYYGAHLAAGLLFALVPNFLVLMPVTGLLGSGMRSVALWTAFALSLQYIFYLGTALLAVQLAGNRVGMVLIYGIINFATVLLYWFVAMVFIPLIYGKDISIGWIARLCPTVAMYDGYYLKALDRSEMVNGQWKYYFDGIQSGELWPRAWICAGLGCVCMAAAQVVYRHRKLEAAGDLVAFPGLSPVFLTLYTLTVAAFFHVGVKRLAQGSISVYFFLPLGLIAGYITGLMLLRRTSRVFRWRLLVPMGGILVACALCVLGIMTDVFHVIRYVPKAQDVASVTLAPIQLTYSGQTLTLNQEQEIQDVIAYHQGALRDWQSKVLGSLVQDQDRWYPGSYLNIQLRYTMKNGRTLQRRYFLEKENPAYARLAPYLSSPELSLGMSEAEFRAVLDSATKGESYFYSTIDGQPVGDPVRNRTFTNFQGLADAILADCAEGTMLNYDFWNETYGSAGLQYSNSGCHPRLPRTRRYSRCPPPHRSAPAASPASHRKPAPAGTGSF